MIAKTIHHRQKDQLRLCIDQECGDQVFVTTFDDGKGKGQSVEGVQGSCQGWTLPHVTYQADQGDPSRDSRSCVYHFVIFLCILLIQFVTCPMRYLLWLMNFRGIDQFRFLRCVCLVNLKGSVGMIVTKTSVWEFLSPLTFHLGLSYHWRVSSVLVTPHRF